MHSHDWMPWKPDGTKDRSVGRYPPKKLYFVCRCGSYKSVKMQEIEK